MPNKITGWKITNRLVSGFWYHQQEMTWPTWNVDEGILLISNPSDLFVGAQEKNVLWMSLIIMNGIACNLQSMGKYWFTAINEFTYANANVLSVENIHDFKAPVFFTNCRFLSIQTQQWLAQAIIQIRQIIITTQEIVSIKCKTSIANEFF